jgi:hypothetical protein
MKVSIKYIITLLFSILNNFTLKIIGTLYLSEIFSFFYLFINKNYNVVIYNNKLFQKCLQLLFLLLFFQIISDIYNETSYNDFLRGWFVIIFSLITTIFLIKLQLNFDNFFISFFTINIFVNIFFNKEPIDFGIYETNTNYFKSRFIPFLNPSILILSIYLANKNSKNIFLYFILLSYSIINFIFEARSNGLIFLILTFLFYVNMYRIKITTLKFISFFIIIYSFYLLYVKAVLLKYIGGKNSFTQLTKTSNIYNPFEIFLYGRSELPTLFQTIIDKPFFGHGSWGKDIHGKYSIYLSYIAKNKFVVFKDYISAHSIIFGYFSYAGVFAFFVILFLFFYLYKNVYYLLKFNFASSDKLLLLYFSISMFWNFLFSPIGLLRTDFPYFLSLIVVLNIKKELNESIF